MSQNELGGQYGIIYICVLTTVNSRTLEIVNLFWNILLLLIRSTYNDVSILSCFLLQKKYSHVWLAMLLTVIRNTVWTIKCCQHKALTTLQAAQQHSF